MRRLRITITISKHLLEKTDKLIDHRKIRNRSHAIEYILSQHFQNRVEKAVILAGGKGTKLRPYTYEMPKSLLPIKGYPLLEYLIRNLKKNGISDIIISIGHLGKKIKEYFGAGEKFAVNIRYSEEDRPLQTGGALLKVKKMLDQEPFLVVYGDILSNFNFSDLIEFHREQNAVASIALTTIDHPAEFGQLTLHGRKLVHFYQKTNTSRVKSYLINCGIYLFEPQIFEYLPTGKTSFLLEDVIEKLIREKKVNGFVFEGQWFDVGDPKNYERAIKEFHLQSQK
ncbi:NTP transferase domain-containing protein [Candidatus Roizmanbacteria bacterium]|nr:NTP transferase domain-containing protein [Candidatus Roizmanbacteria bacterium]